MRWRITPASRRGFNLNFTIRLPYEIDFKAAGTANAETSMEKVKIKLTTTTTLGEDY